MNPYHMKQRSSKKNAYPTGTKKLIDEEMPEPTNARYNVPSVIARLMGMDMLPLDIKPKVNPKDRRNKNARNNIGEKDTAENHATLFGPTSSKQIKELKQDFLRHGYERGTDLCNNDLKLEKLLPKEHPQEEQLQKFKKEFEAWQASKAWERSRSVELENKSKQEKINQTISQENLYKEAMAQGADSRRIAAHQKYIESKDYTSPTVLKTSTQKIDGLRNNEYKSKHRNRSKSHDFAQFPRSSLSKRIVILKPGPERTDDTEESWAGSPEIIKDESGTEEFLEKVKERLKLELKGNVEKDTTFRGGGIPLSEKPTYPKEIAQLIAKKVRESVMREFKMNLLQSESTRLYKSDAQLYGPGSPTFIDQDKGKFLSERLRNILRNDTNLDIPFLINKSSLTSFVDSNEKRMITTEDVSMSAKMMSPWGNMKVGCGVKAQSFRHKQNEDDEFSTTEVLPRSLVRSLSAPKSGTSLSKLLLDKADVLASVHTRRKHEATEDVSVDERKYSKHKVGFRGKFSNLRYSFNLRGKLFGRKFHSVEESKEDEIDIMKAFMTEPSVMRNFGFAQDNSTEVPPSPASVYGSPQREFFRPGDHPSPVSTSAVSYIEDQAVPQVFREISSNLHDLRKQLDQLQFKMSQEVVINEDPSELEGVDLEGEAQVYIRDVLVAAGFYDGSSMLTCPIHSKVFEEVEAAYKRNGQKGDGAIEAYGEDSLDHRLLFDLLNEALSTVLRPSIHRSGSMRGLRGPNVVPHGKTLLDHVWKMIHTYVHPPRDCCHSIDDMAAHDLGGTPWSGMMHGETEVIGTEMEWMIVGDLVEEIMKDMWYQVSAS